jgi:hypothetical protein
VTDVVCRVSEGAGEEEETTVEVAMAVAVAEAFSTGGLAATAARIFIMRLRLA